MILLQVDEKNAQQRFDKYLKRILPNAPASLIYKQLRKKNIVLNGKKADGSEKLQAGDEVRLFSQMRPIKSLQQFKMCKAKILFVGSILTRMKS